VLVMRKILAIDPGSVSAAYAVLEEETFRIVDVDDVPVVDKMVDAAGWSQIVEFWEPAVAVIEQVSAMPKQGVASSFRFGMGCGLLRGVVIAVGIPVVQVAPSKWKRDMGLDNDGEKSRALALRHWPKCAHLKRKKDHGRAEALLLARWFVEKNK
jgi:Holliday junction resolvasome RuvABC endonuclease subunit